MLDSNLAVRRDQHDRVRHPGCRRPTISAASPLPTITKPVIIDGTTQPGYAGKPSIAIVGQGAGDADPLTLGSDVTVKGVAIGGSGFSSVNATTRLAVESVPISSGLGGNVNYQIVVAAGEDLVATAQAAGTTTSLTLLDALGRTVVQSDGLSAAEPIDAIDIDVAPGTYRLEVRDDGGAGTFTLTAMMTPSATAFQAVPVGNGPRCDRGRGLHRRWGARPGRRQGAIVQHGLDPARQRGWHVPVGRQLPGRERSGRDGGRGLQRRWQARPGRREWGHLRHRLDPAGQRRRDVPASRLLHGR